MSNKTIRLSATHEISEQIVVTWVVYSALRLLGFQPWQTMVSLVGVKGEDGRYVCLQLFANGKMFEIAISRWNFTRGDFELAWSEFGALLAVGAFDGQMLSDAWKKIFEAAYISEIPAEIVEFGIIIPEPNGLVAPVGGYAYDVLSRNAIERSRPVTVVESSVEDTADSDVLAAMKIAASSRVSSRVSNARSGASSNASVNVVKRARDLSIN